MACLTSAMAWVTWISRDTAAKDRLQILSDHGGVFRCRTAFNCTEACPREIHVTQAIAEVKQAIR